MSWRVCVFPPPSVASCTRVSPHICGKAQTSVGRWNCGARDRNSYLPTGDVAWIVKQDEFDDTRTDNLDNRRMEPATKPFTCSRRNSTVKLHDTAGLGILMDGEEPRPL